MGDPKVQRILGKEALAKRPRKPLHDRVKALLEKPDPQMLLPPPPPIEEKEQEMMDLGLLENEEWIYNFYIFVVF